MKTLEITPAEIRAASCVRSAPVWRFAHACLPLGQRLNPCLRWALGNHSFLRVPWGRFHLTIPGDWLRLQSSASGPIYRGPRHTNPEYFVILKPHLKDLPQGTMIDVGANIGAYVLNLRTDRPDPIIAFEPDPSLFALLTESVRFSHLTSISLKNVACGDVPGELCFAPGINGNVVADSARQENAMHHDSAAAVSTATNDRSQERISVPVVRLDDELTSVERVSLIKIDCEGFEWNILNGCQNTIRTHRPMLFVELHPKLIGTFGHGLQDVCQLLRPYYHLRFWDADATQRSTNRWTRFFGRYGSGMVELEGEEAMLSLAASDRKPDQLFLLAVPK